MEKGSLFRHDDLVDNPAPRVPICLCLDTSSSMGAVTGEDLQVTGKTVYADGKEWQLVTGGTARIEELQNGLVGLFKELSEDEIARYSAEICIVSFNSTVQCLSDFLSFSRGREAPELVADGNTHLGEGVNLALSRLERRKEEYKDSGIDYFQPWLVIMTDGENNGDPEELERAVNRITALVNEKRLVVFSIGIGDEADMDVLNRLSPGRKALKLQELRFADFFQWLSQSVARTSQSMPGDRVELDEDDIGDWAELD